MKQLHWVPLSAAKAEKTIFRAVAKHGTESLTIAEEFHEEIEEDFSALRVTPAEELKEKEEHEENDKKTKKKESVGICDTRRQTNLEIMLRQFEPDAAGVALAVYRLDPVRRELNDDNVQALVDAKLNEEEFGMAREYYAAQLGEVSEDDDEDGKDEVKTKDAIETRKKERLQERLLEKLLPAEALVVFASNVPRWSSKLAAMITLRGFEDARSEIDKSVLTVRTACAEVMNSSKLELVLGAVLSVGNYLNAGTRKGQASGFKLDALLKLTDTRTRDRKMTLLHYVLQMLERKSPGEIREFREQVPGVFAASKVVREELAAELNALTNAVAVVGREVTMLLKEAGMTPRSFARAASSRRSLRRNSRSSRLRVRERSSASNSFRRGASDGSGAGGGGAGGGAGGGEAVRKGKSGCEDEDEDEELNAVGDLVEEEVSVDADAANAVRGKMEREEEREKVEEKKKGDENGKEEDEEVVDHVGELRVAHGKFIEMEERLKFVQMDFEAMVGEFRELAEYVGEDAKHAKVQDLFLTLVQFTQQLERCLQENDAMEEKKQAAKRREERRKEQQEQKEKEMREIKEKAEEEEEKKKKEGVKEEKDEKGEKETEEKVKVEEHEETVEEEGEGGERKEEEEGGGV